MPYFVIGSEKCTHIVVFRTSRLGFDGADSVKRHPFFKNEQWTFANIRHSVPPIVHEMSSDDDTRNFDEASTIYMEE